jgi:ribosome-associated translation inhibitor RaiA
MNLDIQTEHILMRPEWHDQIHAWVTRFARFHPEVAGIDLTLRHGESGRQPEEEVDVVAMAGRRSLRVAKHAELMSVALHDAFDALEHELLVHEAMARRA